MGPGLRSGPSSERARSVQGWNAKWVASCSKYRSGRRSDSEAVVGGDGGGLLL